jgi:cytochrome c556
MCGGDPYTRRTLNPDLPENRPMHRTFRLAAGAVFAASAALCLPAAAQFAKPEDAIKYRQSVMFLQGTHLGRIFAMVSGRAPFDAKAAVDSAVLIDTINKLPFVAFVEGSDKGNTRAKPEIWAERAKFDAAALKMQEEVAKLVVAAKTGDQGQIRSAAGAVGGACKACHDAYQKPL